MNTYQSSIEGAWSSFIPVLLTVEQQKLMRSREESEAKTELINTLSSQRIGEVSGKKTKELSDFYNTLKPELKEEDVYELISIDILEKEEGIYTGILNFRINSEHKQIRF